MERRISSCMRFSENGVIAVRAHAAGVGTLVTIQQGLVILGRDQGKNRAAIGEDNERRFFAGQALLDDHAVARAPQGFAEHEVFHGLFGLHLVAGNHHSLAGSQPVRFHHHRKRETVPAH